MLYPSLVSSDLNYKQSSIVWRDERRHKRHVAYRRGVPESGTLNKRESHKSKPFHHTRFPLALPLRGS